MEVPPRMSPRQRQPRVAILFEDYPNANRVSTKEIEKFLQGHGCDITLIDLLKFPYTRQLCYEDRLRYPLHKLKILGRIDLAKTMRKWADIIDKDLKKRPPFDMIICESFLHSYIFTKDLGAVKLLDLPTPFSDELRFGGEYNDKELSALEQLEQEIYPKADYLSFHWQTYNDYVIKRAYDGKNFITLNRGCNPKKPRATFHRPVKTVCMGYLGGYWLNIGLLSRLSGLKPGAIEVYGLPKPPKKYKLKYFGFGKSTVLADYQFGLITISKDPLRCEGFSAKHLDYISYGLPVLVPKWRKHLDLIKGSIPYTVETYEDLVDRFSDEDKWKKMSDMAYDQAKKLAWKNTLAPLIKIIDKL